MDKLTLYQRVVVRYDIPEENLQVGDVAWLIDKVHDPVADVDGYILEIFNMMGESVRIATVPTDAIESLRAEYLPSVRLAEPAQ